MLFGLISEFSTTVLDQTDSDVPIYFRSLKDEIYDDDYWGIVSKEEKIIYTAVGASLVFIACCLCGICCYKRGTRNQAIAIDDISTGTVQVYEEDGNSDNAEEHDSDGYHSMSP